MGRRFLYIAIAVVLCLAIGFLGGVATQTSIDSWYVSLNKPSFNPPNWIFAPVWTLLYILMGVAAGIVWAKGFYHRWVKTALYYFGFQLLFNAAWSMIFFGLREVFWALVILLGLLVLLIQTIRWFLIVDKRAAYLLLPYLLWICFALTLNFSIWQMN